jgi:hypothetical protein
MNLPTVFSLGSRPHLFSFIEDRMVVIQKLSQSSHSWHSQKQKCRILLSLDGAVKPGFLPLRLNPVCNGLCHRRKPFMEGNVHSTHTTQMLRFVSLCLATTEVHQTGVAGRREREMI